MLEEDHFQALKLTLKDERREDSIQPEKGAQEYRHMENDAVRQVLLDYRAGKIDKYEAMEALELDRVRELLKLMAQHGIGPELEGDHFQSDPSAPPVEDYFTEVE